MKKYHKTQINTSSNIFLTAEHSSKHIPRKYKNLGLSKAKLKGAKDLYDPGTKELLIEMQKKLQCSCIYSNISRLVIDYNRRYNTNHKFKNTFHAAALKQELLTKIKEKEVIVPIPQNQFSSQDKFLQEEKKRYNKYVWPYRNKAENIINALKQKHGKAIIVQIHSFYPVYNGNKRNLDVGILFDKSEKFANRFIEKLRQNSSLDIRANEPWKMKDADGGIFHKQEDDKNIELIVIETNIKLLNNKQSIKKLANLFAKSIEKTVLKSTIS